MINNTSLFDRDSLIRPALCPAPLTEEVNAYAIALQLAFF